MLLCPECLRRTRVLESRLRRGVGYRRRACDHCEVVWISEEQIVKRGRHKPPAPPQPDQPNTPDEPWYMDGAFD